MQTLLPKTTIPKTLILTGAAALSLLPTLAWAHAGMDGHTHGLEHGFLHPLTGIDHVLAMIMVGVLAWRLGARATWQVPTAFIAVMALGGVLGAMGLALPAVEMMIALSVLALGVVVMLGVRPPAPAAMALVGAFALFHGFAHGAEQPAGVSGLGYAAGFLIATTLLHAAGIGMGGLLARLNGLAVRAAGAAASVAGVLLVLASV